MTDLGSNGEPLPAQTFSLADIERRAAALECLLPPQEIWEVTLGWPEGVEAVLTQSDLGAARRTATARLETLAAETLAVLMSLVMEDVWHPEQTPPAVPDLPDDWWTLVRSAGLPLIPDGADGGVCVPPAVQDALAGHLARVSPQRSRARHREAAERHDLSVTRRVWHLWHSGQATEAAQVLETGMLASLARDDVAGGLRLRRSAPEHLRTLRLDVVTAWTRFVVRQDLEDGRAAEQLMLRAYESGSRDPLLLAYMATAEMHAGRFGRQRELCEEGLRLHPEAPERLRLKRMLAIAVGRLGDPDGQLRIVDDLIRDAELAGNLLMAAYAANIGAEALQEKQQFAASGTMFRRALDHWKVLGHVSGRAEASNNYASMLVELDRPDEALALLAEAMALPNLPERWWRQMIGTRAYIRHMFGHHEEAMHCLREDLEVKQASRLAYYVLRAALWLAERLALDGQPAAAQENLRLATELAATKVSGQNCSVLFTGAVLAFGRGDLDQARAGFIGSLNDGLYLWDQARAHAYLMVMGEPNEQALLDILSAYGHAGPLKTDARVLAPRLAPLLAHRADFKPWISALLPDRVEVEVTLFGRFALRSGGREVKVALQKSRELLAYLLLHGPSSRSTLMTALWPEAGRANVEYFKQALKRLRESLVVLLPGESPIEVRGGRYHLHGRLQWWTGLELTSVFPGSVLRVRGSLPEAAPFLQEADVEWIAEARGAANDLLIRVAVAAAPQDPEGRAQILYRLRQVDPDHPELLAALSVPVGV